MRAPRSRTERAAPVFKGSLQESAPLELRSASAGFTLLEIVIVAGLIGTLSAIVIPTFFEHLEKTRRMQVMVDLREIDIDIAQYGMDYDEFPPDLTTIGYGNRRDYWGNPYQYLNIAAGGPGVKGHSRKNRSMVPVNSDYDLYSMGPDGKSRAPFTAKASRDDIVRASNGAYFGLASEF